MTTTANAPVTNTTPVNTPMSNTPVSAFQNYVTTPVTNTMNYPKLAATILSSYVVLEVLNHMLIGAYVMPWLTSTFALGATATTTVLYGTIALGALGVSWLAYKFFFKNKPATPVVNPNVQYVPVVTPN